jgi:hypothetical protein
MDSRVAETRNDEGLGSLFQGLRKVEKRHDGRIGISLRDDQSWPVMHREACDTWGVTPQLLHERGFQVGSDSFSRIGVYDYDHCRSIHSPNGKATIRPDFL